MLQQFPADPAVVFGVVVLLAGLLFLYRFN